MSTSLAEQLQRLAVPQTDVFKRDKKRASLLFDPKEAAALRKETVFQIGFDGLEELISLNPSFEEFQNTLFHFTSKDFERSVQSAESNEMLDKHIRRFFLLLSPYFLLNCSHKALEWLIHRYSIHEYNRDDLIMLILPYHESNIFVRAVQLLKFKEQRDSWLFLKSLQKPGVHLPKNTLLNHAVGDPQFLKFVSNFILQLVKEHEKPSILTVAFNFYCSVFTGVIEFSDSISETHVTHMLPALLKGLNSDIPDFCAASYVILARLLTKTTLADKILDKFMEKVAQVGVPSLKTEATLVFLVMYQSQKQYCNIPEEAAAFLATKDWLPAVLQELDNNGCFIYPFLTQLVKTNVQIGIEKNEELHRNFVTKLLDELKLDEKYVPEVLNAVLDAVKMNKKYSGEVSEWLTEIVQSIETQYPAAFDKEICQILSENEDTIRKRILRKILKDTMTLKSKFDVFEKLNHPSSEIRSEAVKFLAKKYDSLREGEKEMLSRSFKRRLLDDNPIVLKEALTVVRNVAILPQDQLKIILVKLIRIFLNDRRTWKVIINDVISMLCVEENAEDFEVLLAVFPLLIVQSEKEFKLAKKIIGTEYFKTLSLLEGVDATEWNTLGDSIVSCLKRNREIDNVRKLVEVLKNTPIESRDELHKFLGSLILSSIIPDDSPMEIGVLALEILEKYVENSELVCEKSMCDLPGYVKSAKEGRFPLIGFLNCVGNIIEKTERVETDLIREDFLRGSPLSTLITKGAKIFYTYNSKAHAEIFLGHFVSEAGDKVELLLNLVACGTPLFGVEVKRNILKHILHYVKSVLISLSSFGRNSVPFLLTLFADADKKTRSLAVSVLDALPPGDYALLLQELLKNKEEILLDHKQAPLIVSKAFETKTKRLAPILDALVRVASSDSQCYLSGGVLALLTGINNVEIFNKTAVLARGILVGSKGELDPFRSKILTLNIARLEETVAGEIENDSAIFKFIETAMRMDKSVILEDEEKTSPLVLVLNQLTRQLMCKLKPAVEMHILDLIIEMTTITHNPEVLPAATKVFKHIELNAELILPRLLEMLQVQSPKLDPGKKKRRVSVVPTIDILDTLEWRKGVTTLEFIQDKKKLTNLDKLLEVLFNLLKRCLEFDEQAAVEYPKQLLLSSILQSCSKLEEENLPSNVLNTELIVQCIRASQNPQTHHHALLVLSHIANFVPEQVLHHIMAIFTFIGSSVLRHDDAYSFYIISKILETIIPILIQGDGEQEILKVLRVFVDVLQDVPEHRRLPLYRQLLEKVDVKKHLYLFLLLVFDSHVTHSSGEKQGSKTAQNKSPKLDFATKLCLDFEPKTIMSTFIELIEYSKRLPVEKPEELEVEFKEVQISLSHLSQKQFRHYKYVLILFISNVLSLKDFVDKVASLEPQQLLKLEKLYKDMIVNILTFIQSTATAAEKFANTPQSQYWKVLLHHSYDILDSLNALLTPDMFLLVVKGLLTHNLKTVRRRSLELLNSKLQHQPEFFNECPPEDLQTLINPLISIIEGVNNHVDPDEETIIQTALLSLKLLVRALAPNDPEKFIPLLDFVTGLIKSSKGHANILASLVLCIAELCSNLRAHALSSLPNFMPAILKVLKQQKHQDSPSLLMLSLATAVQKILESLPLFMSPYLQKIIVEMSLLWHKWEDKEGVTSDGPKVDQKTAPLLNKLGIIRQKIASVIPLRVLIPAVEQTYSHLIEKETYEGISPLMLLLKESLTNLHGNEVSQNLQELTTFFLTALQFRDVKDSDDFETINAVESSTIDALTTLVLKLSETTFRPFYYKLFDWAIRSGAKSNKVITFYHLSYKLAEHLKGLFVLFAGHFLANAAFVLDACNPTKSETLYFENDPNFVKNTLLLENTLKTLHLTFKYDTQRFLNKDRFDLLMQPIVDQLENDLGGLDALSRRNEDILTPCIVQFAVATADDSLWKQMNYQVLLKMRSSKPAVRLVALRCLTDTVKQLGESFLPLLPETIPFLAELLEDEEEEVEKCCQKAVQEMEKVLGEPLQKYF